MSDIPEYDLTKDDTGAAGGASGGGDDDAQDWELPDGPAEAPDKRRRRWPGGARPKYPYERVPQHDKDTPMSTFPKEKSGLPTQKGTAETSFSAGMPSERVKNMDSLKMELAYQRIQEQYPQYGKDGNLLTLEVVDGKVFVVGPKGSRTNLFQANGRTLNPQLLKLTNVQTTLGPPRTEEIEQKDQEIEQTDETIAELDKTVARVPRGCR